jgi:hypothetical protein
MQILLANAKIMNEHTAQRPESVPMFQDEANVLAMEMARCDIETISEMLGCDRKLSTLNLLRYQNFFIADKMPALFAYNGQAYKHLKATTLTPEAVTFGQKRLWITCFLYGLLRPMDGIVPYRMERNVRLEATDDKPVYTIWKDRLTEALISSAKADDGIITHLSTAEYELLFDWKKVKSETRVIQPLFYVRAANGKLKTQAVWAKSCRGAMVKYILENRITTPEDLCGFSYEGFEYRPELGDSDSPHFVREF